MRSGDWENMTSWSIRALGSREKISEGPDHHSGYGVFPHPRNILRSTKGEAEVGALQGSNVLWVGT